MMRALLVMTLLLMPSLLPAAGGVVMEGQRCTMYIDFYSTRFTAYQPDTKGSQEFCEEVPDTGLSSNENGLRNDAPVCQQI